MQQQQKPGGYRVVQKGMSAVDIWAGLGGKACSNRTKKQQPTSVQHRVQGSSTRRGMATSRRQDGRPDAWGRTANNEMKPTTNTEPSVIRL